MADGLGRGLGGGSLGAAMIIQACLNGGRAAGFHPRLPVSAAELAEEGAACVAAGASELHVHPRGDAGDETLGSDAVAAAIAAIRRLCPGTLVGVSTGEWIEGTPERTLAAIQGWRLVPDYASVNLSETGAQAVMAGLWCRGVAVEAGLGSVADARRLVAMSGAGRVIRVLIEIEEQDEAAAMALAGEIDLVLVGGGIALPRLLHGFADGIWPLVAEAARREFSTRVGLEDGDRLPDGTRASGNAALVAAAVRRT